VRGFVCPLKALECCEGRWGGSCEGAEIERCYKVGARGKKQEEVHGHRMQRVKVYRLNSDGLWDDKGTGHVSVEYLEVRPELV